MGVQFSEEAAKRIASATRRVEEMPRDMAGDRTREFPTQAGLWAVILGHDISGLRHTFNKVIPDRKSTMPRAFVLSDTINFGFDGEPVWEAAREVNGNRGIRIGTVVWLTFYGYDTDENPVYLFSHPDPFQAIGIPPHDHRDNLNGLRVQRVSSGHWGASDAVGHVAAT